MCRAYLPAGTHALEQAHQGPENKVHRCNTRADRTVEVRRDMQGLSREGCEPGLQALRTPFVLRQLREATQRMSNMPQAHPRNCGGSIAENEEGSGERHGSFSEETPLSRLVFVNSPSRLCHKTWRLKFCCENTQKHVRLIPISIFPRAPIRSAGRGVMVENMIPMVDFMTDLVVQGRIYEVVPSENLKSEVDFFITTIHLDCFYRCRMVRRSMSYSLICYSFTSPLMKKLNLLPLMVQHYIIIWSLMESWSICVVCMRMMARKFEDDICDTRDILWLYSQQR